MFKIHFGLFWSIWCNLSSFIIHFDPSSLQGPGLWDSLALQKVLTLTQNRFLCLVLTSCQEARDNFSPKEIFREFQSSAAAKKGSTWDKEEIDKARGLLKRTNVPRAEEREMVKQLFLYRSKIIRQIDPRALIHNQRAAAVQTEGVDMGSAHL